MIQSARRILNGLFANAPERLTSHSLHTLLYEVAAIINGRPLSVEALEDPSGPLPLTPSHILTGKSTELSPPPGVFQPPDVAVKQQWRRVQSLAEQFWRRWRQEYLSALQRRRKWIHPQRNLQPRDVVSRRDGETPPRGNWSLARVVSVKVSGDGLVRSCVIRCPRTPFPKQRTQLPEMQTLERPVNKLVLLLPLEDQPAVSAE